MSDVPLKFGEAGPEIQRLREENQHIRGAYEDCRAQWTQMATHNAEQAAEITRLRAELATARREGMKDAAKWHEVRSMELSGKAGLARNFRQLLRQSDFHMESAAAIRTAAGEGK